MKVIRVCIDLNDTSYEVGRLESNPDTGTFDGWLEETGKAPGERVISATGEWWARYVVLRRYMDTLLAEIDGTNGGDHFTIAHASERVVATAVEMETALLGHMRQDD